MICQLIKLQKKASLIPTIFFCLFSLFCFSQEAESIYHSKYSKLSIVLQPSILLENYTTKRANSSDPNMEFSESKSIQFGVYYNFAQSTNWNFKTGLIVKDFSPSFDINVSSDDIGLGENYLLTDFNPFSQFIFSVPIKTEYFLPIYPKFNLIFGASINLNLITGTTDEIVTKVSVSNETTSKEIFYLNSDSQEKINFTSEISSGIQYKSKYGLIQLDFFWTLISSSSPITGRYKLYNLEDSNDFEGSFTINPFFYGLSLNFSPKKGWLKKNSNK